MKKSIEPEFWWLAPTHNLSRLARWIAKDVDLESIVCPLHSEHQRAGRRRSDLSVFVSEPATEDFVWTWYSECLVGSRVEEILRTNQVTGFELRPAIVNSDASTNDGIRLSELIVTGWGGIAPEESGIRKIADCDVCGFLRYSCFTEPQNLIKVDAWDGSDIFMVWPLPRYIFISEYIHQRKACRDLQEEAANWCTTHTSGFGQVCWRH
jgi:hypothetical protein